MQYNFLLNQLRLLDTTADAAGGMGLLQIVIIYGGLFAVAYFFFIRPNSKKKKKEEAIKKNAQVGDEITTIGGISGRIIAVKNESDKKEADSIIIETGSDRTKIRVKRWAIGSVDTIHDEDEG